MDISTHWHTPHGAQRLLQAMRDVGIHRELAERDHAFESASPAHQRLFEAYVPLLRQGQLEALPWWEATVRAASPTGKITQDALDEAYDRRMAGPASDPRIVWIVRTVWLQCCELNRQAPDTAIRPEYLMVQWLIDAGEDDLVRLLACMPYWPLGLDEDNRWC